jgi:hypothetical protein
VLATFENNYSGHYDKYGCELTSDNPEFNLVNEFDALLVPYNKILSYNDHIGDLERNISSINNNYNSKREDYNTSLIERIANKKS